VSRHHVMAFPVLRNWRTPNGKKVLMDNLLQDLRYAFRMLFKSPGFTALAIITLALGIGANTAIFSVIYAVLLKPMPYPQSDRLALIREKQLGSFENGSVSYPNYLDWRATQRSFTDLAMFRSEGVNLSAQGESEPERLRGSRVTANMLLVLGLKPRLGRDFTEAEDKPGAPHVALIGDHVWRERFGASPEIIGRRVTLNGVPTEIIGVLPAELHLARRPQVFLPLAELRTDPNILDRGNHPGFSVIARLKDGVTLAQARAEFETIARNLEKTYPDKNTGRRVNIRTLLDYLVGDYRSNLYVLFGAVACVLLIACANVAGLLLARATGRQRELAVRAALGASRFRLTLQLMTESIILALIGGFAGIVLAVWGLDLIVALSPANEIRFHEIHLNFPALIFTLVVATLAGLLAGAWPAWRIAGAAAPAAALHEGGRLSSDGLERQRLRAGLVVVQVALALVLLTGAGLLLKSFWQVQRLAVGFNPDQILEMSLALPKARYPDDTKIIQFYRQLLDRVRALPGVISVAAAENIPFDGDEWDSSFHITGTPPDSPGKEPSAQVTIVSADYFRTMGIPLVRGRVFGPDDRPGKNWAVIIDESFARRFFAGQDPIGKHLDNNQTLDKNAPPLTIVGVVGRVRNEDPADPFEALQWPQMYYFNEQLVTAHQLLLVRFGAGEPLSFAQAVKREVLAVDPEQPVSDIDTMRGTMAKNMAARRLTMTLIGVFAGLALMLAAIGLFGVMALRVTQRTREIGIRLALGAQRTDVFRLIIGNGLKLVAIGVAIGLISSFALTRLLAGLLFGVGVTDPWTFALVVILLGCVALLANYLPARRATKVDPIVALHEE
jgi:putative ABC transport system permease protein